MSDAENQPRPIVNAGDFGSVDFQKVAQDSNAASSHVLMRAYEKAYKETVTDGESPEARAYRALVSLFSMGMRPDAEGDIWVPMWTLESGRSALPQDFAGEQNEVLADLLHYLTYPPLTARIADVVWTNDRSKGQAGNRAVQDYCSVAVGLAREEFESEFERDGADLLEAFTALDRAVQISAYVTGKKKTDDRLLPTYDVLYSAALAGLAYVPLGNLMDLGFRQGFRTAGQLAADGEAIGTKAPAGTYAMAVHGVLRKAAHYYERAGDEEAKFRCLTAAVDQTLAMRLEVQKDSGAEAHWVDKAIRELEAIPGTETRRAAMEVELRDLQKKSLGGMASFSFDLEVGDDREKIIAAFGEMNLSQGLLNFAHITSSPDPEQLRKDALEMREVSPLMSLIPTAYVDGRGRTTKVVGGSGTEEEPGDDWYWRAIEIPESIRRVQTVAGFIEPARQTLMARFNISEAHFAPIVGYSPFVPPSQRTIFALGFTRLFQRDFISAAHLLLAQIEGSVRKALLDHGFDASKRRDDGTVEDLSLSNIYHRMPEAMDKVFGANLAHEIRQVFAQRPGPALRHEIAHGKLGDGACYHPDVIYACWLIYRITCLPLTGVWQQTVAKALEDVT